MADDFDDPLKRLAYHFPQAFVSWGLMGGIYKHMVATELKKKTFKADIVMEVELNGKPTLRAIEF